MKFNNTLLVILLLSALLLLAACSSSNDDSEKTSSSDKEVQAKGGEKFISVWGEYSYCYSTPENYDPTQAFACVDNLTYKECLEWKEKEPGEAHTFFYAVFEGGEPTIPGRTANVYFLKIHYGDNLVAEDDKTAFQDYETEFYASDLTDCYPKATMEMYTADDKLVGKMSFDYTND